MRQNIFTFLTIILLLNGLNAWRSFVIELTLFRYEINHEYIGPDDVKLIHNKGHNVLNGSFVLKKDVLNPRIYFDVIVPRPETNFSLFNITTDVCKPKTDGPPNLLLIVLAELRKTKSFCPLEKDKIIVFDNMYMDAEKFPAYVPDMDFKATLILKAGDDMVIKTMTTGSIISKRAMRKNNGKTKLKDGLEIYGM